MSKIQAAALRKICAGKRTKLAFDGPSTIQAWFSPNTASKLGKTASTAVPADLAEVYAAIDAAKQSVLFLAFMPGKAESANSMHFLKKLAQASVAKPALFVRGAVSDPDLTKEFDRTILASQANEDAMISSPQGMFKNFQSFRKEIYKFGHAIIHDKVIVIDPLSASDSVVVTGSHNLGFRASSNNDENMLIIRGNAALAQAYAMHVMDVFEHYRSRWISANNKSNDYDPAKDPNWQLRYFDEAKPSFAEREFWLSGGAPLAPLKPNPKLAAALAKSQADLKAKQDGAAARKAAKAGGATGTTAGKKVTAKKVTAKKVAAKKVTAKKAAGAKAPAKNAATKKTPAKKAAAKKAPAKKAASKKAAAKKTVTRKAPAKKAAAKKSPAKKAPVRKAATKKAPAKRAAAKKAPARKAAAKKVVSKRAPAKKLARKKS